jgi:hypothetical protein
MTLLGKIIAITLAVSLTVCAAVIVLGRMLGHHRGFDDHSDWEGR